MRTSFQAAAVLLALTQFTTAQGLQPNTPRQWTQLRLPEYGFSLEFPAPPSQGTLEGGEIRWAVELDNNWTAYLASTVTLTEERVRTAAPKRILDDAVEGGRNRFPTGTVLSHTEFELGGNPGRHLVMLVDVNGTPMRITSRVVLSGRRLYIATAVQRESALDHREADRFLRSFALISQ